MNRFDSAGAAFARLCETMATLRAQCPWDREQTLESLKGYLIEESYEVLEAIDGGEPAAHRDELGDLLLQIVFQAEICQETDGFDAAGVADAINDKLIRRHPHVFDREGPRPGDGAAVGTKEIWEGIKARERGDGASRLAGIPKAMPALLRATRVGEKAAAVGFDWPDTAGVVAKVEEEWAELGVALDQTREPHNVAEEMGDLLFALVSLSRHCRVDAEIALGAALEKFEKRFFRVEGAVRDRGVEFSDLSLDQLDALWEDAKTSER